MRSTYVHSLVAAYKLPQYMSIIKPTPACRDELAAFHTDEYIDFLLTAENEDPSSESYLEQVEEYGLQYDCPVFAGLSKYLSWTAGGTLAAAKAVTAGDVDIGIHWDGGRHHAQRDRASGFCYVNDIVLGIFELQKAFKRILYIDIDIHHGDGVESAFLFSPRVFTCSFHKYDGSFFPGTGSPTCVGRGNGGYHTLNIPLRSGLRRSLFFGCFQRIINAIREAYDPDCMVLQCGADGAHGNLNSPEEDDRGKRRDRGEGWNLDVGTFGQIVSFLCGDAAEERGSHSGLPLLILGGGGYVNTITAKCWARATAAAIGKSTDHLRYDVPEHALWAEYGNETEVGIRKDENEIDGYIEGIIEEAMENIRQLHNN